MAPFKVPREMASGFLTIGGTDLTAHIRSLDFDEDQPTIDIGTVADPSATALGRIGREAVAEFVNSFADKATGSDGLYDVLTGLVGTDLAVVFQPHGAGTDFPKWEWTTDIGYAPIGEATPDEANIIEMTIPVRGLTYTKSAAV